MDNSTCDPVVEVWVFSPLTWDSVMNIINLQRNITWCEIVTPHGLMLGSFSKTVAEVDRILWGFRHEILLQELVHITILITFHGAAKLFISFINSQKTLFWDIRHYTTLFKSPWIIQTCTHDTTEIPTHQTRTMQGIWSKFTLHDSHQMLTIFLSP